MVYQHVKRIGVLLVLTAIGISSCKKKTEEPVPDTLQRDENVPKGKLYMHLHNYLETTEMIGYGAEYNTNEDRRITFDLAQFYLSGFELVRLDGSVYQIPGAVILKDQEIESYEIADVPVGNYKTVRFKVGVKEPGSLTGPIALHPEMWFDPNSGNNNLIYLNVKGSIDTSGIPSETRARVPFQYKIGTTANLAQVTMPDHGRPFVVVKDQAEYIHLYANWARLFDGINLRNPANLQVLSPADNVTPIAARLAANSSTMFVYEE